MHRIQIGYIAESVVLHYYMMQGSIGLFLGGGAAGGHTLFWLRVGLVPPPNSPLHATIASDIKSSSGSRGGFRVSGPPFFSQDYVFCCVFPRILGLDPPFW